MDNNLPRFVKALEEKDETLFYMIREVANNALNTRALDEKTKYLISLALDVMEGSEYGTKNVAQRARAVGASEDEIKEVLRLVYFRSGVRAAMTSINAFEK